MKEDFYNGAGVAPEGEMIHPSKTQLHFRPLRADEVEVRPAEVKSGENPKVSLLLYQDARSAMNILDLTVGPKGWQKEYYEAAGLLFCKIGIYDQESQQWLWKADTGSKSNIEEDKGLASDCFKRSAVAWGIARELYTAPRIIVDLTDKDMFNGKLCQTFRVSLMTVTDGTITDLVIVDKFGNQRFEYHASAPTNNEVPATSTVAGNSRPAYTYRKKDNETLIRQFCANIRNDPETNIDELDKFLNFYLGPSDKVPGKRVIDTWTGTFDCKGRWEKWMANVFK